MLWLCSWPLCLEPSARVRLVCVCVRVCTCKDAQVWMLLHACLGAYVQPALCAYSGLHKHSGLCSSSQGFAQAVRAVYVLHTRMCRFECVRTQSVNSRHRCSQHCVHICACWGAYVCPASSWYVLSACGAACAPGVLELRRCWQCPESCVWAVQGSGVGMPALIPLVRF